MHPHIFVIGYLSWMIEIWMKNHLVSGMNHNIVDLPCPMAKMLGLHLVYVTTTLYYLLFLATTKTWHYVFTML